MDDFGLDGRVVVVTGASSGIGWETAKRFALEGAQVALVARREDRLHALARLVDDNMQGSAHVYPADLSLPESAARTAATIEFDLGPIDVLVNNAGSAVGGPVWAVADHQAARRYFEVDFWSPLALIQSVIPSMRQRRHGAVVNVTSIRIILTWPFFGHSSAACAALSKITETLRLELAPYGVHVVEVIPGPVETPAQGPTKLIPGITEALHDTFGMAQPEDVADRIVTAVQRREPLVFCPEATTRAVYEDPVRARAKLEADVRRLLGSGSGLPDEALDTLVVAAGDPLIEDARAEWEREHGIVPQ